MVSNVYITQADPSTLTTTTYENFKEFISNASQHLNFAAFIARDTTNTQIGEIYCQIWAGPLPLIPNPSVAKFGSIWNLNAQNQVVSRLLIKRAVAYLKELGVSKVVTLVDDVYLDTFVDIGFRHGNARVCVLDGWSEDQIREDSGISVKAIGEEGDALVVRNWLKMWVENGVSEEMVINDYEDVTLSFIADARARLKYQTFGVIDDTTGETVGTLSCQIFSGPFPNSPEIKKAGSVWAVYVNPEYRRRGIATRLMNELQRYFKDLGMDEIRLLYASEAGCRVYEKVGFEPRNVMVLDQPQQCTYVRTRPTEEVLMKNSEMLADLRNLLPDSTLTDRQLTYLLHSVPHQLSAVTTAKYESKIRESVVAVQKQHNSYVDVEANWFTANITKMGTGFDMKLLSEIPSLLASKFDRLANKWEDFVTGCGYSPLFTWLCDMCEEPLSHLKDTSISKNSEDLSVMDLCCAIGLPGHTLRMMGYEGYLSGCDISPNMLEKAADRDCYNELFVDDVNERISATRSSLDLIVCTGAMELLNIPKVLLLSYQALKPSAELWVSFQWNDGENNPTAHQNIIGLKESEANEALLDAGFEVLSLKKCDNAFVTPQPGGELKREEEFGPCTLSPELKASANDWNGRFLGLNYCGRLVIEQQNCYNCNIVNPLTDRSCICDKWTFKLDVLGAFAGNGKNCAGQADLFNKYYDDYCTGKSPAPSAAAPQRTSPAVIAAPKQTTTAPRPTTLAIAAVPKTGTTVRTTIALVPTAYAVSGGNVGAVNAAGSGAVQQLNVTSNGEVGISRNVDFSVLGVIAGCLLLLMRF
ncbi:hypothetical protein HK098_002711 [Nowakowskiella sp. JEL0407]|nr:hypothetical protein HK098_002711 [Nowakowskiella sp. JEL0407]